MRIRCIIAAALAATSGSAAYAQPAQQEAVAPAGSGQVVEATDDRFDRMTVPVLIEGQGPFRFMIDTGAQATVVTRSLNDRLGFEPAGTATLVGMASAGQVDLVRVDGLEFAERTIDNLVAPLLNAQHVGADGILGLDSLQDLRVLLDFRTREIHVDDAEALGGNAGYEIVVRARSKLGRLIITDADIGGVRTAVIIDTGAQGSIGNLALQRRLRAKNRQLVTSTDVLGNELVAQSDFVRQLKINRLEVSAMPIAFADTPAFEALGLDRKPAIVIGMDVLRIFDRVAIDFASRKVLFDMPRGRTSGSGLMHTAGKRL